MPLGPVLVTADEAGDPQDMRVRGWLNGDLRQDSNTADMIFSVAEIIAYASRFMTLEPGDVILTGTPEGVVLGRPQKDWVVPGDVYDVEVGELLARDVGGGIDGRAGLAHDDDLRSR